MFGLKRLFSYTHIFPCESIIIFQDPFNPPQELPSGLPASGRSCFYGPEAWMEGLRQKGWTLITIYLILLTAWEQGTTASLLGQGDNQVILLKIPHRITDYNDYVLSFINKLVSNSNEAGLPIKGEETWYSRKIFEYSRKYFVEGAQVSSAVFLNLFLPNAPFVRPAY